MFHIYFQIKLLSQPRFSCCSGRPPKQGKIGKQRILWHCVLFTKKTRSNICMNFSKNILLAFKKYRLYSEGEGGRRTAGTPFVPCKINTGRSATPSPSFPILARRGGRDTDAHGKRCVWEQVRYSTRNTRGPACGPELRAPPQALRYGNFTRS